MTHCPDCTSFGIECDVEEEDYSKHCKYFTPYDDYVPRLDLDPQEIDWETY